MTKYREYYEKMISENKDLFDEFTQSHFEYSIDQDKNQENFNKIGGKVLNIIHEYENRLCKTSEGAGFGSYTTNLAEKFQAEIKSHFPLVDHIGIIVSRPKAKTPEGFSLKKIKLN
jgi:hypothetical protein